MKFKIDTVTFDLTYEQCIYKVVWHYQFPDVESSYPYSVMVYQINPHSPEVIQFLASYVSKLKPKGQNSLKMVRRTRGERVDDFN